jgi:hypothetical protein|mmetsp:Transcript_33937/g.54014  ORF Transcript_33937/g.54014 Transcript_33937/m.54014 type:complete len:460 (-) Transcript_33937:135-1514(-)
MEVGNMLIWFMRILLPIILFCVYFKLQSPKDSRKSGKGKGGPSYSRDELIAKRTATLDCPAPEEVAGITLQECEASPARVPRNGGKGKGRQSGKGDKRRGSDSMEDEAQLAQDAQLAAEQEAIRAAELKEKVRKQERLHTEAFINHVSFNRSERQRVFLPDGAPPPPPPLRRDSECADPEVSREANIKADSVLRGAMTLQRAEIVSVLHDRLLDQQIEVEESTYILMVELCLLARDLKMASDFLLKMENAGHVPDPDLLDRVMDLYNQQKILKEQKAREKEAEIEKVEANAAGSSDELGDVSASNLSSQAPAFVPTNESTMSLGAAPFVPNVAAAPFVPSVAAAEEFNLPPDIVHDAVNIVGSDTAEVSNAQRTKLKSTSKSFVPTFGSAQPFEPQFGLPQDQYMYPWTLDSGQKLEGNDYPQQMQGQDQYVFNWQMGDEPIVGNNESDLKAELFPAAC